MGSKVMGLEAFRQRHETIERTQYLQEKIDQICERAVLVLEYPEAGNLDDLKYVFQERAMYSVASRRITDQFLAGTEFFSDIFVKHQKDPKPLVVTDIKNPNNPRNLLWHATNAWLKYITAEWRGRTWKDALYLKQFAFNTYDLWVRLTVDKRPGNVAILHAFEWSTQAGFDLCAPEDDPAVIVPLKR